MLNGWFVNVYSDVILDIYNLVGNKKYLYRDVKDLLPNYTISIHKKLIVNRVLISQGKAQSGTKSTWYKLDPKCIEICKKVEARYEQTACVARS